MKRVRYAPLLILACLVPFEPCSTSTVADYVPPERPR